MTDSDAKDLPTDTLNPLDRRHVHVLRLRLALAGLVPLVAVFAAALLANREIGLDFRPFLIAAGLLYLLVVGLIPRRRYRRWGYGRGADSIRIVSGWIVRKDTVVPFARVQHIDVGRGPIERMFGVATLTLHTAGSYNSTVDLPGLALDDANRMREEIREHIRHDLP